LKVHRHNIATVAELNTENEVMKEVVVFLIGLSCGGSAILAQTGTPAAAVASSPAAIPPTRVRPDHHKANRDAAHNQRRQTKPSPEDTARPVPPQQNLNRNRRTDAHHRKPVQPPAVTFSDATRRQHHERHDHRWWTNHYRTIVFVNNCGYYYWDAGYWFPAFGYAPQYESYDYDGPIFTYGNLLPDQVIYNVQRALKDLGYYGGPLTGSLSQSPRAALAAFQEDNELEATGAIDAPTVEALGLY
jgi:Putative peptidoglycan binding domain